MTFKLVRTLQVWSRHFRTDASTSNLILSLLPTSTSTSTSTSLERTTITTPKKSGKSRTPPKSKPKIILPELNTSELLEKFVRGSGPGGQAVQKTSNAVSLIHIPTGTHIFCHETRSRETNRQLARRRMQEQLDLIQNGGSSKKALEWNRMREMKESRIRKAKRKIGLKELERLEKSGRAMRRSGTEGGGETLEQKEEGALEEGEGEKVETPTAEDEVLLEKPMKKWEKKRLAQARQKEADNALDLEKVERMIEVESESKGEQEEVSIKEEEVVGNSSKAEVGSV